jgi:hypothetical protein
VNFLRLTQSGFSGRRRETPVTPISRIGTLNTRGPEWADWGKPDNKIGKYPINISVKYGMPADFSFLSRKLQLGYHT